MTEPTSILEFADEITLAKRCTCCIKHKKKCHRCFRCVGKRNAICTHIAPGIFRCVRCKKSEKDCLFQCKKCYKKNKFSDNGPFPSCTECRIVTRDPPIEYVIFEEGGKIYFQPIDGSNNKFEINDEIFGKLCELKRKNGYNLGRHVGHFLESSSSTAEEIPIYSENAADFHELHELPNPNIVDPSNALPMRESHEFLDTSAMDEIQEFFDYPNTTFEYGSIDQTSDSF
ncbi:3757_t:CDS:2 [Acaulospora morrowiae]|uniref:3757_t:CDS:1 n=1 Tax=Acaulospora morrowiae TaxID=94023 RepID=A0A9N8ZLK8_9GLOM|nr:3757_t:CDS:2 [Acaulospora morrowiae]